jgi:hypothetical protein
MSTTQRCDWPQWPPCTQPADDGVDVRNPADQTQSCRLCPTHAFEFARLVVDDPDDLSARFRELPPDQP